MSKEELEKLSREELRELAERLKIDYGKTWGAARFVEKIMEETGGDIPEKPSGAMPDLGHTAVQLSKPLDAVLVPDSFPTVETLTEALEEHIRRGLKIDHIDQSTWQFTMGKRQDSGTMHQPLQRIVRCASILCRQTDAPEIE